MAFVVAGEEKAGDNGANERNRCAEWAKRHEGLLRMVSKTKRLCCRFCRCFTLWHYVASQQHALSTVFLMCSQCRRLRCCKYPQSHRRGFHSNYPFPTASRSIFSSIPSPLVISSSCVCVYQSDVRSWIKFPIIFRCVSQASEHSKHLSIDSGLFRIPRSDCELCRFHSRFGSHGRWGEHEKGEEERWRKTAKRDKREKCEKERKREREG